MKETERKSAVKRLLLLVTVVNRSKAEFYTDLLLNYEVNLECVLPASGTRRHHGEFGDFVDSDKAVLFSVIREDKVKKALAKLEEKFAMVKGGDGIAFTVPFSSTVGVSVYRFLSNQRSRL